MTNKPFKFELECPDDDDWDYCYDCFRLGCDSQINEDGDLVCNCPECPRNPNRRDDVLTTDELIEALRELAAQMAFPGRRELVRQAADRLEELDERVSVMAAEMDNKWTEGE